MTDWRERLESKAECLEEISAGMTTANWGKLAAVEFAVAVGNDWNVYKGANWGKLAAVEFAADIRAAITEVDMLRRERDAARSYLRDHQWRDITDPEVRGCPECGGLEWIGHNSGCLLAVAAGLDVTPSDPEPGGVLGADDDLCED